MSTCNCRRSSTTRLTSPRQTLLPLQRLNKQTCQKEMRQQQLLQMTLLMQTMHRFVPGQHKPWSCHVGSRNLHWQLTFVRRHRQMNLRLSNLQAAQPRKCHCIWTSDRLECKFLCMYTLTVVVHTDQPNERLHHTAESSRQLLAVVTPLRSRLTAARCQCNLFSKI